MELDIAGHDVYDECKRAPAAASAAAAAMDDEDLPEDEDDPEADTVAAGVEVASGADDDDESEYDGEDGPEVEEAPIAAAAAARPDVAAVNLSPAGAAAAEAAVEENPELLKRAAQHARFRILPHKWKELERGAYARIQAPTGVAPAAKHPLTKTGEMTAHHWVNFVRCYGKYLLQQAYGSTVEEQHTLAALCRILDLLALCLRSHVSTESKQQTATLAAEVLEIVKTTIPTTEHAIVVHLLLRHIPDTINLWGPVRSYWCFPFER